MTLDATVPERFADDSLEVIERSLPLEAEKGKVPDDGCYPDELSNDVDDPERVSHSA